MKDLAQRLFEFDAKQSSHLGQDDEAASRICKRLRIPLSQFAGSNGYSSLLSRALSLAKAEVPALDVVRVLADGSLDGLRDISKNGVDSGAANARDAGVAIVGHFLRLLVTFVGESLTMILLQGAWPEESFGRISTKSEEKNDN